MEKIKISGSSNTYDIQSIRYVSDHVIKIVFDDKKPESYTGDISVYTEGGVECSKLTGFVTVYLKDNTGVYLSDDKSVYVKPEAPESPDVPDYVPTLEDVKASKKYTISAACQEMIYKGIDVELSDKKTHHFSLSVQDQLNLFGKQLQIASGATKIEYHSDGDPCVYYSTADMTIIINQAMSWVSYNTTYCNSVYTWIDALTEIEDVKAIVYGAEVPEKYQSDVLKTYIASKTQEK